MLILWDVEFWWGIQEANIQLVPQKVAEPGCPWLQICESCQLGCANVYKTKQCQAVEDKLVVSQKIHQTLTRGSGRLDDGSKGGAGGYSRHSSGGCLLRAHVPKVFEVKIRVVLITLHRGMLRPISLSSTSPQVVLWGLIYILCKVQGPYCQGHRPRPCEYVCRPTSHQSSKRELYWVPDFHGCVWYCNW